MKIRDMILLALVGVVVAGVVAFAGDNEPTEPAGFTIGTDSLMIAAPRLVTPKSWVLGTQYSHGDMVRSTNHLTRFYWNVSGVTNLQASVTMPDQLNGDTTDGGTNVWRRIKPKKRLGIQITNPGTNDVWLSVGKGNTAVANTGMYVIRGGGSFSMDNDSIQDAVNAVATNGTLVTTQEY